MKVKIGFGKVLNFAALALAFTSTQAGSAAETSVTYEVIDIAGINSNCEPKIGVTGVSADGSVVLGWYRTGWTFETYAQNHFLWKNGELTYLSDMIGPEITSFQPIGVSADGTAIFGMMTTPSGSEAFRLEGGIITGLGLLPEGVRFSAEAVSADGSVFVGSCTYGDGAQEASEACRWENGLMTTLGDWPIGEYSSIAKGVSADGSVVVIERWGTPEYEGTEGFRWENGVMSALDDSINGRSPFPVGISGNGSVVVGSALFESGSSRAFRWENGLTIELEGPEPGPSGYSWASSASFDGSVAAGFTGYGTENGRAVFWSEANEWRPVPLRDLLEDAGIDRDGYWLGFPIISADGSTIVGSAIKSAWNNPEVDKDLYRIYRIRITELPPDPLIGGRPVEAQQDWFRSDWWGTYCTTYAPWLFHAEHGFLFRHPESTSESMYVYDDAMAAWCWTNEEVYPFIYAFNPPADDVGTDIENAWLFYFEDSGAPRVFGVVDGPYAGSALFFGP